MSKQPAPPPIVSKQGGTHEHPWDKALDCWRGCGKLESLSEVLLFPVLSILQLGSQLVSLSLGTISHLSSLPQRPASRSGARLGMCPGCIPPETALSDSSTALHLPAGGSPSIPCPESSSGLWMEITIHALLFLGQEGGLSLFPAQAALPHCLWLWVVQSSSPGLVSC